MRFMACLSSATRPMVHTLVHVPRRHMASPGHSLVILVSLINAGLYVDQHVHEPKEVLLQAKIKSAAAPSVVQCVESGDGWQAA